LYYLKNKKIGELDFVIEVSLYMVMAIENAAAEFEDIPLEKYNWK
jgi:hypothetical protein